MRNILFKGITNDDEKEIRFTFDQILFTYLEDNATFIKMNEMPVIIRFDSIEIVDPEYFGW